VQVAAHHRRREEGVDAIVHMAEVVRRMDRIDRDLFSKTTDSRNGKTVFHTGTLRPGRTTPRTVARGARHRGRDAAGRAPARPRSRDRGDLRRVSGTLRGFSAEVDVKLDRDPFVAEGSSRCWRRWTPRQSM
jgi:acetylornithine deacetylase